MNQKRKKVKKTGTKKRSKFQIKTFIFDMVKETKKSEQIDEPVNAFLMTADVKNEESIIIDQGEGYVRVSIIHRVKANKV